MPRPRNPIPTFRHHKATEQAVVTVHLPDGTPKDLYLGRHDSDAARAEYARILAVLAANHGTYPASSYDLTINEALLRYLKFAVDYYRGPDGKPSRSLESVKLALRYLRTLFGPTLLVEFAPPHLKAIRETMIREGRVRRQINKHCVTIRQFFRWCVEEQLVPVTVLETLKAVRPLAPGRSGVIEGTPREPADPVAVEASLKFMSPAVRAIVQLLRLTGARPTEILTLKREQVDCSNEVWRYSPPVHKTSWKGKTRVIHFGPESQVVLQPWLETMSDRTTVPGLA
jgi:integrase